MAAIKGMSLFKKTGLIAFCLFGVIASATSAMTAWTLYGLMTREYVSKGTAIAQSIAGASQEILLNRDAATVQSVIDQYLEIEGVAYVFVVDGDGLVVSHTFVPEFPPMLHDVRGLKHEIAVSSLDIPPHGAVIDICAPVLAGLAGFVHVGMGKELIMAYFWEVVLKMQILLFFIFWGCVGILYLVMRRISRPLGQLTDYARKLAAHDFSAAIDIRTRDELEVLGRAMMSMGQELALLFSEMENEVGKATADLRDHMAYLAAIIDNLADGLLVVDVTGAVSVINPAMREFFDLGDTPCKGRSPARLFPVEVTGLADRIRRCTTEVLSAEIPLARGRTGKAVGSTIFAETPGRQCLGGVLLVRDITREKELDQLKTDFISTVSHELRTPMTSVLGFSKIIRNKLERYVFPLLAGDRGVEKPIGQVRGNMDIIVAEAERLTELINDVLDIARMEAGEVQWRDENVPVAGVLRQSVEATRGLWQAKGLAVEIDVGDDLPPVRGDHDRLVQVVVNLLSNAVKFTEVGPIRCSAEREGGFVRVSVRDNGAGIDRADLRMVFDKFKQVGDTLTGKPEGSGLGLPICRQIVERHGGSIWVESEPGRGSVFTFTIPLAEDEARAGEGDAEPSCRAPEGGEVPDARTRTSPLVLVVDDDPALIEYLSQVFEERGYAVCEAANGPDAVATARSVLPDLITMDIMMPGMDGHEVIARLRALPETRAIPILVITALGGAEGEAGDMALVKPVDDATVIRAAESLLRGQACGGACIVLGGRECDLNGMRVLCSGEVTFATAEEFWPLVEDGFRGTVFISSEVVGGMELERLSALGGVSVVILPPFACKG
ncbi:Sensor protein SrrB [Pseudodesulfovibrio hydrargyri]|uniref:histidine kinase n=1 Tax=Pseudodesulfovibrio hydrargyri TaxID=2125990 RepID=A0A1J5MXM5_9BACT|nr:ATP-binding protein [Pseudodesulfovibrio hydrargyri]OIQ50706.1 Sensor protein SrrB [Pseudodesulfovibrio hydrargyri]